MDKDIDKLTEALKGGFSDKPKEKVDIVAEGTCVMCSGKGSFKVYETNEILCSSCYNINKSLRKK